MCFKIHDRLSLFDKNDCQNVSKDIIENELNSSTTRVILWRISSFGGCFLILFIIPCTLHTELSNFRETWEKQNIEKIKNRNKLWNSENCEN